MKLIYRTDKELRNLVAVNQMFGPPDSPFRRADGYASFISKEFYIAAQVAALYCALGREEQEAIWLSLLGDRSVKIPLSGEEFSRLRKLLSEVESPLDEAAFKKVKRFSGMLQENIEKADYWTRKIFGVPLPEEVIIIPFGCPISWSNSGTCLVRSPVVVGMTMGYRDHRAYLAVILHEVLHALVGPRIKQPVPPRPENCFEEALLDYFVSDGILAEKAGFLDKLDLNNLKRENARYRGWAAEESEKLFPVMKEYYPICGEKTIWEFLREKGLGDYLRSEESEEGK
jgi:hypothetical protein